MRYFSVFIFLFFCNCVSGQILVTILPPPSGMIEKQQLWSMIISNTGSETENVEIQMQITDAVSGEPVLSAETAAFTVLAGSKEYSENDFGVIQYNILSNSYLIDPGPLGLLPVGNFNACYTFLEAGHGTQLFQQCILFNIPALAPPMLVSPEDKGELDNDQPLFTWLPPVPSDGFNALQYDLKIVPLSNGQIPSDAIEQNPPLLLEHNIIETNFQYPNNGAQLDSSSTYVWQVTAFNNLNEIGKSEIFAFALKNNSIPSIPVPDPMYVKLEKNGEGNVLFFDKIRLDYFNETADTTWQILVQDVSQNISSSFVLLLDSIKMKPGQNLLEYDAGSDGRFISHHIYLLELPNSRGEVWKVRFE